MDENAKSMLNSFTVINNDEARKRDVRPEGLSRWEQLQWDTIHTLSGLHGFSGNIPGKACAKCEDLGTMCMGISLDSGDLDKGKPIIYEGYIEIPCVICRFNEGDSAVIAAAAEWRKKKQAYHDKYIKPTLEKRKKEKEKDLPNWFNDGKGESEE